MKRFTAGMALGAILLSASGAFADARTDARAHFKKGMQAIAEGKYEEGISELQRAYEILAHPSVLYNIARAYAESGDLESAVANYKKYLEGNPPDKDEVGQIVNALEARIERQKQIAAAAQQTTPTGPTPTGPGATTPGTTPTGPTGPAAVATGPEVTGPTPGAEGAKGLDLGKQANAETEYEEVQTSATKAALSPLDAPNSVSIITEQDIRLSGLVQIPDLLRRLAGVDVMESTNSQSEVSLRGFNQALSNKIIVLVDGRSTYVDLIGSTFWAAMPIGVEDIERIEVVRGPGAALYGANAFNGVINIITKAPGDENAKTGFNVAYGDHNFAHGSFYATGREKEWKYRLSAGYDYFPRWNNEIDPNRTDVQHANFSFGGDQSSQKTVRMNANITRDLGGGWLAGASGGYTKGNWEIGPYPPLTDIMLDADVVDVTGMLTSKHLDFHAFYNSYRGQNSLNANYVGQSMLPSEYVLNVADAELQYIDDEHGASVDNSLHIGIGYRYKDAVWGYIIDGKVIENWEAVYLHDEFGFGKQMNSERRQFQVVGDIRGDYVPYLNKIEPSPKGSVLFHPSGKSTIRGIVGTAFRIPTFLESYLHVPIQLPIAGASLQSISTNPAVNSPHINAEQVLTEELGYMNSESDFITFDSAFFHNNINNLIELAPNRAITVGQLAGGNADLTAYSPSTNTYPLFFGGYQNQCQTYNVYGAELGARANPTEGLDIYANYTYMNVAADTSGCNAAGLANYVPDQRTSAHKVNAGIQLRTNWSFGGIDASADLNYLSDQTWALQIVNVQEQRIQYQQFHLDPYALINMRIGYRFLKNKADLGFIVNNLLNNQHREYPFSEPIGQRIMGTFAFRF
jgi:iron complex outermembrane receptor protein